MTLHRPLGFTVAACWAAFFAAGGADCPRTAAAAIGLAFVLSAGGAAWSTARFVLDLRAYRRAVRGRGGMSVEGKAAILDAVLAEHAGIIRHWPKTVPPRACGCDASVGHVCEECALADLVRRLDKVLDLYPEHRKDRKERGPCPANRRC